MSTCQVCREDLGHGRCFVCRDYRDTALLARNAGVPLWSGHEARALRTARRMSIRDFADHLGVSDRVVSKWEAAGERIHPRPVNQAALDTSLSQCSATTHERFRQLIANRPSATDV
jgi:hypothetical protein